VAQRDRPEVPEAMLRRLRSVFAAFPKCREEPAWVGTRWRVGGATVAHVFGGEDQLFRIVFRAEPDEVMALQHLGPPYFRGGWGRNVVGLILDDDTDWDELAELLTDSYCVQAPASLAQQVSRPG
jgi:hypothetical protein